MLNFTEDGADDIDHHTRAAFNFVYLVKKPKLSASHLIRKDQAWKKGDLVLNKTLYRIWALWLENVHNSINDSWPDHLVSFG